MKKDWIAVGLITTALVLILVLLYGLICWGIGVLFIRVFDINYEWTYLHGLATSMVLTFVGSFFRSSSSNK